MTYPNHRSDPIAMSAHLPLHLQRLAVDRWQRLPASRS
jgi:hypothetical protein